MSEFLSNLYTFKGRLGRLGFIWKYVVIFASIIFFALIMAFGTAVVANIAPIAGLIFMGLMYLFIISLGFIPPMAVTARRLHDIGLSGWWQLLPNFMLAAFLGLIVFSVIKGGIAITGDQIQTMGQAELGLLLMQSLSGFYATLAWICLGIVIAFGLMLLFWPGTKDINKYDTGMGGYGFQSSGQPSEKFVSGMKNHNKYLINFVAPLPEESMYLIKGLKDNTAGICKITMPQDRASAVMELSNISNLNQKKIKKLFSEIGLPIKSIYKDK